MKTCTSCKETKPLDEFHNCKSKKDGKFARCKTCRNQYNKEKAAQIGHDVLYRLALEKDPDKYKQRAKKYYQKNKEGIKAKAKEHKLKNPEKTKESKRKEYERNKDKYIKRSKNWVINNKYKRQEIARDYSRRFYNDPKNRPAIVARKLISRILNATGKNKSGRTFNLLGYNKEQLEAHIEAQFTDGMTWDNHGVWHIDHIISVSEFVKLGVEDPKIINALQNLRPIWASDNLRKSNGFDLSVQVQYDSE